MGVTVCCITYNIIYNGNGWILYGCRMRGIYSHIDRECVKPYRA